MLHERHGHQVIGVDQRELGYQFAQSIPRRRRFIAFLRSQMSQKLLETNMSKMKSALHTVTLGLTPAQVLPLFANTTANGIDVDAGWMQLWLGCDVQKRPMFFAKTVRKSMLYSALPPLHVLPPKTPQRKIWVYAIDALPPDFTTGAASPAEIATEKFEVKFGRDQKLREYLLVRIRGQKMQWLFRNPASHSTEAWNIPAYAIAADAQQVHPSDTVSSLGMECTGDEALDEMFRMLSQ